MTDETIRSLKDQADRIKKEIHCLEEKLGSLADGKLYIQKKPDGRIYYRIRTYNECGKRVVDYLPKKNMKLIRQLAERTYYLKLIPALKDELEALQSVIDCCVPDKKTGIWAGLDANIRDLVIQRYETAEEADMAWQKEEYARNGKYPEHLCIKTLKGDMVRSKTEALIADMLYHAGVSYRYEAALYLSGLYTSYPDFTIRRKSDGKIFYWEHFGLLDDPDYLDNTVCKLDRYAQSDIILGDNLLITWETGSHPFDRTTAEKNVSILAQ